METFGANFILLTIVLSTAAGIIYFIVISYIITQMDKRHFVHKKNAAEDTITLPYLILMNGNIINVIKIAKIFVGVCLLLIGLVMLVLPGQGLITMLIGLSLLPFPGKDKMEQSILSLKSVRSYLNWIRMKAKKEPFIFD